jgi:hypothetical protein
MRKVFKGEYQLFFLFVWTLNHLPGCRFGLYKEVVEDHSVLQLAIECPILIRIDIMRFPYQKNPMKLLKALIGCLT